MNFEDIVKVIIFLFGTALQITILALMVKRKGSRKREIVFAFFTFSVLSWSFGIFISLFSGYIYRGENIIEKSFGAVAILSYTLIFPLLVHSLINYMAHKNLPVYPALKYPGLLIVYLPTIFFTNHLWNSLDRLAPVFQRMEIFIVEFIPWAFVPLVVSWYIAVKLCRKLEEREERQFLGVVGWGVTLVICFYFLTFVLGGNSLYIVGPYLTILTEILTFSLPPMLAFYLYYYNYMEYVFKRGMIYCLLGIFVITFHISFLRPLGATMENKLQVNFRIVEGIAVMGLVFFFDPVRRALQELSNRIFFKERKYYHKVFSEISVMINQNAHSDLESLLYYLVCTIKGAMKIKGISCVLFEKEKEEMRIVASTIPIYLEDIQNLSDYIEQHRIQVLKIYGLGENESEIIREMRKLKAFTIIPIYNEGRLIGIFNVGKRRIRHQLLAEEEEMLIMLANQMVITIENTRLTREKFAMERIMYENEKLSSLGRLSASIAHEVKNPLSSIKTITQVMKEELPLEDANQEGLTLIIGEIDRLSRVVNQLLRFARPHARVMEKLDLDSAMQNVLLLLRHEAERNQVEIVNQLTTGLWTISDKDALSEIFFNLILNSIQVLPEGGKVNIDYIIEKEPDDSPQVIITIADNGPGISDEDKEKIFEPFYTTKQTGTGLGLSIVKNRLQKLKGTINIDNTGPGVVFQVTLPFADQEDDSKTILAIS